MSPGRTGTAHLVFMAFGGLLLLFIIAPLAGIFINLAPGDLLRTAREDEVSASIWLTLAASMGATVVFAVLAIPFAWILARREFRFKQLVNGIVDLPIVIPHSAAGIALIGVLSPDSPVGAAAERIGIRFAGGVAGIMAAMAFVSVPFLVNAARDGFAAVPVQLEKAALNLGASPLRVFLTISVPAARRSILSGLVLMWARGMSEFGAVIVIAYHPMITPVLLYERFGAFGLRYARPVTALFIAICLLFFFALRVLAGRRRDAQG
ncbi:MAG: ABC transporter permease [Candidatus Krumholzibacteria bacterium]|jgi:molybdate/tungstate transport system permease protein|nr:ABC transporter permease [Candidatus Krumholzibacteria bacterium]